LRFVKCDRLVLHARGPAPELMIDAYLSGSVEWLAWSSIVCGVPMPLPIVAVGPRETLPFGIGRIVLRLL
jgi:hypothetical protein